jgi:adenine-specific DNA-methyltransferase
MKDNYKARFDKILKKDSRLWDKKTKELNKALLKDLIDKLDEKLIKMLLSDKEIREKFFIKVKNVFVLKQNELKFFIDENKLDNSYTQYKNKIGLRVGNKLLSERDEVVLDWPFKDCVLEGGMTKEDQKRNEIFFNEILAKDEIDRLFEPKALKNWKRYTAKGEKKVKEIKRDKDGAIKENLIIKGNNLLALHSLKEQFAGKIKLIYIDPPYNTGGAANTFIYNNNFNHSSWLTFMKNRIEAAKVLLKDDGVICIAIDDEEYAHLKLISDEVFGRDNYIGTIVVQSNPRGRTTNSYFATSHEYTLFYGKNITNVQIHNQPLNEEQESDFKEIDEEGKYRYLPFRRSGGTSTPAERPNSDFSIYYSLKKKQIIAVGGNRKNEDLKKDYSPKKILVLDKSLNIREINPNVFFEKNKDVIEILPIDSLGKRRVWRWSDRKKILISAFNNNFKVKEEGSKYIVYLKDRIKEGRKPKTIWSDSKYDASANGTILLKNIFNGEKLFSYPKSLHTVKDTIKIITGLCSDDIVLDFFGGSGTTAHAVLQLNKDDGGNRKFILMEQMDYINTITHVRVQKVLAQEKIDDNFIYLELAEWNEEAKEKILKAKNLKELEKLFDDLYERYFLNYNVEINKFKEKILEEDGFRKLSLDKQKKLFVEMLDMNQMYVNFSERADKKYKLSKDDIALSEEFYNK